jgi:outer membrane lipoprotein-sorting protein
MLSPVVIAVAIVVGSSTLAAPPDFFDELHAKIAAAEARRQTVRARFVETTTSSLLVKPLVARGTVIAAKPASVRLAYESPEPKTIVMNGDRNQLAVIRPGGESELIDVTEVRKKVDQYFTNASPGQLRHAFRVRAFVDPEVPDSYQIDLVPTRKQIKQGLERLQIWVGRTSLMLAQMKITFTGGDTDVFRLEDVQLNVPVRPGTFDIPAGLAAPKPKK